MQHAHMYQILPYNLQDYQSHNSSISHTSQCQGTENDKITNRTIIVYARPVSQGMENDKITNHTIKVYARPVSQGMENDKITNRTIKVYARPVNVKPLEEPGSLSCWLLQPKPPKAIGK